MSARSRMRMTWVSRLVLVAAVVALLAVSACSGQQGGNFVDIHDLRFNPPTLTVKAGTTVTWTNSDQTAHTVTSDAPGPGSTPTTPVPEFTSKPLNPGQSYQHKFDKAGTYKYHCSIHPYLKGEVIVR